MPMWWCVVACTVGCGSVVMDDEVESLDGGESLLDESLPDAQDAPEAPMESLDTPEADPGMESLLDVGVDDGASLDDGAVESLDDAGDPDTADDAIEPEDVSVESLPDHTSVGCHGPFEGVGSTTTPGTCIVVYTLGVYEGQTYTVSTCAFSINDPVLAVYGACNCTLYEDCYGLASAGNFCTCTAHETGVMEICASAAQAREVVRWSYTVEGDCYDL